MKKDLLHQLTIEDLPESQRDIAEVIGLDNYLKLVRLVSGDNVYICKVDELARCVRNKEIRRKFNGYNFSELAREYNLTTRTVRTIVGGTIKNYVVEGQMSMFGDGGIRE